MESSGPQLKAITVEVVSRVGVKLIRMREAKGAAVKT
jgi:hypothetical protein